MKNMEAETNFTLSSASEELNVSQAVIRRLCNSGLVPGVRRNPLGHRVLNREQVELIALLLGMRRAGFSTKELKRYSRLYRQGSATEAQRLAMLTTRKHQLRQEINDRQDAIDFIERQEEIYYRDEQTINGNM